MKSLLTILIVSLFVSLTLCVDNPCPYEWDYKGIVDGKYKCLQPEAYTRGAGYPWKFGYGPNLNAAKRRCEDDHPDLGCERTGQIIYPNCKPGMNNFGCCTCNVQKCPEGWSQIFQSNDSYCLKAAQ